MKINSTWYSYDNFTYDKKEKYMVNKTLPNNYLWSKAQFPTKITAKDLPPSFVYGRFYKRWGYIDTANIVDMLYIPNMFFNHFLKDDRLVISYVGKIKPADERGMYENESYSIWGNEIINILKGAREYSNYDIKPFIKQIKEKLKWVKKEYPEEFKNYNPDIDKIFKEPIDRYDYNYKEVD